MLQRAVADACAREEIMEQGQENFPSPFKGYVSQKQDQPKCPKCRSLLHLGREGGSRSGPAVYYCLKCDDTYPVVTLPCTSPNTALPPKAAERLSNTESPLEALFMELWDGEPPKREYKFSPISDHRLDFAWPNKKVALEVDGMVHRIKARFRTDVNKHNLLMTLGWRYYRITGEMLRQSPEPIMDMLKEAIHERDETH